MKMQPSTYQSIKTKKENKMRNSLPNIKVTYLDAKGKENASNLRELCTDDFCVLYFYPKDNTPGCTKESCGFSDNVPSFKRLKAKVVGVSPDPIKSHVKFQEKFGLKLDLISDPDRKLIDHFGLWQKKKFMGKEFMGLVRSTFLIHKGKIVQEWSPVRVPGHVEAVEEAIKEHKKGKS
jgi:peroxiredoxin Q/BCP